MLRVDGISAETKIALQNAALREYGLSNASLLVRNIINEYLRGSDKSVILSKDQADDRVRVVLQLPREVVKALDEKANNRISDRNYYLVSLILKDAGLPQLQGDEIEVLRRSNYELAKIGTNINQIARAFNVLVMSGGGQLPEVSKKLSSLRKEIKEHTNKVLRVLNAGTVIFENKSNGKFVKKRKAKNG